MRNFLEKMPSGVPLFMGLTESGQGKTTGAAIILDEINMPVIRPSDGSLPTRMIWNIADQQYARNGKPGAHQEAYDAARAEGVSPWKVRAANAELVTALRVRGAHLLSMHGAFGSGAERTVVEIDTKIEPLIAAPRTRAFVPLSNTADELLERGMNEQQIEVVGFLVPKQLKDTERQQQRLDTFAQQEPTPEKPLRVAFMTTGQFGHQDVLRDDILRDEIVREMLFDGRMKLDVYMWDSKPLAEEVYQQAFQLGLNGRVTEGFQTGLDAAVQAYFSPFPLSAVRGSMDMAAAADIVVSPIAERVGWTLEMPFISLPPVGSNRKMISNMEWTESNGLTVPMDEDSSFGEILLDFFEGGESYGRRHADAAAATKARYNYDLTNGAATTAELVLAR